MMADYWPSAEGRIAEFMNAVPKVVFSRTLETVDWNNTRLVKENVPEEVSKLKQAPGKNIFVFGSADFAATLMQHDLIDEYRLMVFPIVLGSGKRLFGDATGRKDLRLIDTRPFRSGVVVLSYQPERKGKR